MITFYKSGAEVDSEQLSLLFINLKSFCTVFFLAIPPAALKKNQIFLQIN